MLTCGTTDKDRHFHPFGIGMSFNEAEEDFAFFFKAIQDAAKQEIQRDYNPSVLVADNAGAITN